MAKATHSGTCQICGHHQKLPGNLLANHGYTKQWGFFSGTCYGSRELPFEVSKDMIEDAIARTTSQRNAAATRSENYKAGALPEGSKAWFHDYRSSTSQARGGYFWAEYDVLPVREGMRGQFFYVDCKGKDHPIDCLPYEIKTVDAVRIYQNTQYAEQGLDKLVADLDRYIAWQQGRIRDWQPKPLTAIEMEVAQ